ncbi:hypothetical protein CEUSTIGMA_g1357.t1 [Chlamydomonas eustigma]|uniref:Peptidase M3A/M3B catalytic domain-containing protein n=1 Tax=Chlamydomonas eustigma TaxID=1157962 RepID=A0A250WSU0_9CHLO|nr:hypothetical protein CEUSTIGMA_g1357.t1 [Chlamydomonas eustigma]|eukprot:GAX73907.1 hypothetical protein CEUSTIGMA_g1357.t1 [Chlamydomonas eustigma]
MRAAYKSTCIKKLKYALPSRTSYIAHAIDLRMTASEPAQKLINELNSTYEKVGWHSRYPNLTPNMGSSTEALAKTKTEYEAFLGDPAKLKEVRERMKDADLTPEQMKVLQIFERTFKCYIIEDLEAKNVKERLNTLEAELSESRNQLALGYKDPQADGEFKKCSSVQLRSIMRVNDDEATRKACFEGMRSIGPFVAERFVEIVKCRNRLARSLGYEDYYDFKVTSAEGFGKTRLFEIMDDLETKTRPLMHGARKALLESKGASALEPYNIGYALSGDTEKALDPYFPFEDAVDVWARTFAALGIKYNGATMTLDLCDREKKYSNGFCHWPQVAWRKPDGALVPSKANFTSLATPNQLGSGRTALVTLLHEGGHAAHMANIDQPSPFFGQERAPFSVAMAENQSMFLDAFAHDSAWLGRYARDKEGLVIPWSVIEEHIKASHPYEVMALRAMLAVPYFEKALYELPEDHLSVQSVLDLADKVEVEIQGGLSARPLMSVPHILADEASCYYHGYVLAEMSVHHTRAYFKAKYVQLVDNPKVGADLAESYWKPGNSEMFLDVVQKLTGKPLTADAWVEVLSTSVKDKLIEELRDYEEAVAKGPAISRGSEPDLGMRIILAHGDDVIGDSGKTGLQQACNEFKSWVQKTYFS